jgi:hypothetical protein
MVKSRFGLGCKNKASTNTTCCPDLSADEGQAADSLLSTRYSSSFFSFSTTAQLPCSLTDLKLSLNAAYFSCGFSTGLLTVKVSGLSLMAMPPRENKWSSRLFINLMSLFSSSRYSSAHLGLKGDQNLICM